MRLLAALGLVLAVAGPATGAVTVASVDHPDPIVYNRTYPVNATVRNTGDEPVDVRLFSALYEPQEDRPCGPATGDDYHGTISTRDVPLTVPAGGTATYPQERDLPWWHTVNATNNVTEGGTYEVCTFAYDPQGTTAEERFHDTEAFNVTLRMTNEPPRGSISVDPEEGTTETVFRFQATASDPEGDPISHHWDFHDFTAKGAATATGPEATHEFYPEGRYTVTLNLTDGWDTRTLETKVDVYPEGELPGGTGLPGPGWLGALASAAAAALLLREY
jgi:hypothetical protein